MGVEVTTTDGFSNATGHSYVGGAQRAGVKKKKPVGTGKQKAKDFFQKHDVFGKAGAILTTLGSGGGQNNALIDSGSGGGYIPPSEPASKPMSPTVKNILIGTAVVALLVGGYVIYKKTQK